MYKIPSYIIVIVVLLHACATNSYYPNVQDVDTANRILLRDCEKPWGGMYFTYERVVELVEHKNADVNYIKKDGVAKYSLSPFLAAAGALKCLQFKDKRPESELDSMEMEAVKIVKYLAEKGANVNVLSSNNSQNALHLAACGGREKVIPVLVDLGLDINSKDSIGGTALLHAIAAGDLATVKAVVSSGADINLVALDGNSPLDYAMAYTRSEEHKMWIPYRDQNAIAEYMQSIGAKHGKNDFTGSLYFDESKK